jgi:hypothetical protein
MSGKGGFEKLSLTAAPARDFQSRANRAKSTKGTKILMKSAFNPF